MGPFDIKVTDEQMDELVTCVSPRFSEKKKELCREFIEGGKFTIEKSVLKLEICKLSSQDGCVKMYNGIRKKCIKEKDADYCNAHVPEIVKQACDAAPSTYACNLKSSFEKFTTTAAPTTTPKPTTIRTTTTTTTTTPAPTTTTEASHFPLFIAGAVGGLVVLVLILVICLWRAKNMRAQKTATSSFASGKRTGGTSTGTTKTGTTRTGTTTGTKTGHKKKHKKNKKTKKTGRPTTRNSSTA